LKSRFVWNICFPFNEISMDPSNKKSYECVGLNFSICWKDFLKFQITSWTFQKITFIFSFKSHSMRMIDNFKFCATLRKLNANWYNVADDIFDNDFQIRQYKSAIRSVHTSKREIELNINIKVKSNNEFWWKLNTF
jgi:hypothetical protein